MGMNTFQIKVKTANYVGLLCILIVIYGVKLFDYATSKVYTQFFSRL